MFIYVNPDMDINNDVWYRVEWCRNNKVLPYIMRDEKCYSNKNKNFFTDITSYCNQPAFFKKLTFKEFLNKRHTKKERISNTLSLITN